MNTPVKSTAEQLSQLAWKARENAQARKTKVGCALLGMNGMVYYGCNIELDFCDGLHAEETTIAKMISTGCAKFDVLLLVAEMAHFTPCGRCMDWIMHACESKQDTLIGFQNKRDGAITWATPQTLMPLYPTK